MMKASVTVVGKGKPGEHLKLGENKHLPLAELTVLKEIRNFRLYKVKGSGMMGFLFVPNDQAGADSGALELKLKQREGAP